MHDYLLWVANGGVVTFDGVMVEQAHYTGVRVDSGGAMTMTGGWFSDSGHGVYLAGADATVSGSAFLNNTCGLYQGGSGAVNLADSEFTGNTYPIYQGPSDFVYSGNMLAGNTYQAIGVGGMLGENVTWGGADDPPLPYLVVNTVTVPEGLALHIEAGTVVKFLYSLYDDSKRCLKVDRLLDVGGTAGNPVVSGRPRGVIEALAVNKGTERRRSGELHRGFARPGMPRLLGEERGEWFSSTKGRA